ncbi:tricarballylate utilization 4Fe-4S protein TcuB [Burkholderia latens]|uniref:Tricarballylate utilization 4Fe-4S protein TcuB n=1 Tax=Burkholderia latens TaxID=488446 RepID=A0A6H9SUG2_9BURK|nr:tricarballylate utilization 4Fe-4S protein TcuB [Burkholderia latens]KAB0644303.1 tricarballylate utilization 4Fe-4S protein TcuB [Burkholderia latens]VWB26818.1 tricarballylate utilization protein B [Burkholderia latens]
MQNLEERLRDARAPAPASRPSDGTSRTAVIRVLPVTDNEAEVARQMSICNACRYCEGFCAVFPAMTRRLDFAKADVNYLANLCHNCGACYHACQYAPPHEFAVNVPKAMAQVRFDTYVEYAWPASMGKLYQRNGLTIALALAAGLALFLLLGIGTHGSLLNGPNGGNFYAVFPHNLLAVMFGGVFALAMLALGIGVSRFWRDVSAGTASAPAVAEAAKHALALTYLDGGHGDGCNESDDAFTLARRRFHHFTFYGFMLCFAATVVATFYHYVLDLHAPYAFLSVPVLLGTAGGIGLLIGPAGLLWLNVRRDPARSDPKQRPMDRGFIALLMLVSASGLALLAWRDTGAMACLLAIHLGAVMALFATLPYGKFAHGIFRCAALLKSSIEKRQANRLQPSPD